MGIIQEVAPLPVEMKRKEDLQKMVDELLNCYIAGSSIFWLYFKMFQIIIKFRKQKAVSVFCYLSIMQNTDKDNKWREHADRYEEIFCGQYIAFQL